MVSVNPEVTYKRVTDLNLLHAAAQAWDAGKLFRITLNDQNYARFDQDWRFSMQNLKQAFFLVKYLRDSRKYMLSTVCLISIDEILAAHEHSSPLTRKPLLQIPTEMLHC